MTIVKNKNGDKILIMDVIRLVLIPIVVIVLIIVVLTLLLLIIMIIVILQLYGTVLQRGRKFSTRINDIVIMGVLLSVQ
jgi:hypothetical protein